MYASIQPADAASSSKLAPSLQSARASRTALNARSTTRRPANNPYSTATSAVRAISTEL